MARLFIASLSAFLVLLAGGIGALAAPPAGGFGPGIEGYPSYDGQDTCSPLAKPGVIAFRKVVLAAFPGTGAGGIERGCDVGGTSEHKEGRAWDWGVNVNVPSQKAAADSLIDWLAKEDRYGNQHAMARRLGIMYLIWNRRIWFPGSGWRTYCVQKKFGCHTPGDKSSIRHPHTDHVHFSFTWDGAKKRTTYWRKGRSMLTGTAAASGAPGQWLVAGNGSVAALGLPHHGSDAANTPRARAVDVESNVTGSGYWVVYRKGRVSAFGEARRRGGTSGRMRDVAGITAAPTGKGYWVFGESGRIIPFGNLEHYGDLAGSQEEVVGMAATPTGLGYWLVTATGSVAAFGDAVAYGNAKGKGAVTGIEGTAGGLGYWLVAADGRVQAFGDARHHGDLAGTGLKQDIVGIERTPGGLGYWLTGAKGKVKPFGDAPSLATRRSYSAMLRTPPNLGQITEAIEEIDATDF